jgi:hypothetical protein
LGGAQNVDTRGDRAMVICCPPDEGKDVSGRKRNDAPAAVDDAFLGDTAEPDPALDASLLPVDRVTANSTRCSTTSGSWLAATGAPTSTATR